MISFLLEFTKYLAAFNLTKLIAYQFGLFSACLRFIVKLLLNILIVWYHDVLKTYGNVYLCYRYSARTVMYTELNYK